MATTNPEWIFAGKWAIVLLPVMLIGLGVCLTIALLRDRAARSGDPKREDPSDES